MLLVSISCTACSHIAGHDFPRPDPSRVVLGQTSLSQATAIFGAPESRSADSATEDGKRPNTGFDLYLLAGDYVQETYFYSIAQPPVLGGGETTRQAFLVFRNNVLVGYDFFSSFPNDSSAFDERRADAIVKGRTDEAQVIRLLGPPSGQAIYPAIPGEKDRKYVYDYFSVDPSGETTTRKTLEVLFNEAGLVRDTRFNEHSAPIGQAPGGAGVGGMVFVHTGGGGHHGGGGGGGHK